MNWYKKAQQWMNDNDRLEISIVVHCEDGYPVSSVMKHRHAKGGHWKYDADLDSGEQGGLKDIPEKVKALLPKGAI